MSKLHGTKAIITPRPANTAGPNCWYNKNRAIEIWRGADQIKFKYVMRSINRCESTDIKFTISPTVDTFLAAGDSRSD